MSKSHPAPTFLLFLALFCATCSSSFAINCCDASTLTSASSLPDAPVPQSAPQSDLGQTRGAALGDRLLNYIDPGYNGVADKWDTTINKGEKVRPFTANDKIHYAYLEEVDPVSIFTGAWAAGWEQLRDTDPHYGTDSAAYGERFGAAMFRQGVNRFFGDGLLAAVTHEDPRYYRVDDGSIWHRAGQSAVQTFIRHRDDGSVGINYSGLAAHAMADGLPVTFYPQRSQKAQVAAWGFSTSLAADAGLKLFREFIPDIFQKFGMATPDPSHPH